MIRCRKIKTLKYFLSLYGLIILAKQHNLRMNQPKELSLVLRLSLFIAGLLLVFITSLGFKAVIDSFNFQNEYSSYLIYLGAFCILLWLFIVSLIKIPIGSVGVPLILNSIYRGFLFPAGHTWLPFFKYIPIDIKKQFKDLNFNIITGDTISHIVHTNVEYRIVNPFTYLEISQDEIFTKITGAIEESISSYSVTKEIEGDSLIKNPHILKQLIAEGLGKYGENYGLSITEVLIRSIKPNQSFIKEKEKLYIDKISLLQTIDIRTLDTKKKIEVLTLIAKESGIDFNILAKYDLIDKEKISINELIRTFNLNVNSDFINSLISILKS